MDTLGGVYFWLGASADAETGSRADASSPQAVSTEGFDPARKCINQWCDYLDNCLMCGKRASPAEWR